MKSLTDLDFE